MRGSILVSRSKKYPKFFFKDYGNHSYIVGRKRIEFINKIIIYGVILNDFISSFYWQGRARKFIILTLQLYNSIFYIYWLRRFIITTKFIIEVFLKVIYNIQNTTKTQEKCYMYNLCWKKCICARLKKFNFCQLILLLYVLY